MFKVSLTCTCRKGVTIKYGQRDVAQLGSALRLGRRGRTFESCHPDHLEKSSQKVGSFFIFKIYRGVALTFTPRIVSSRPFRKELTKSGFFFYFQNLSWCCTTPSPSLWRGTYIPLLKKQLSTPLLHHAII